MSAPTKNDKFELSDGSYSISNIQDYSEDIIKKQRLTILQYKCIITKLKKNTSQGKTGYYPSTFNT